MIILQYIFLFAFEAKIHIRKAKITVRSKLSKFEHVSYRGSKARARALYEGYGRALSSEVRGITGKSHMGPPVNRQTDKHDWKHSFCHHGNEKELTLTDLSDDTGDVSSPVSDGQMITPWTWRYSVSLFNCKEKRNSVITDPFNLLLYRKSRIITEHPLEMRLRTRRMICAISNWQLENRLCHLTYCFGFYE